MPNRILKESICTSDDINILTTQEEVFFYRLIVNCDDYGRFDARLPILKAKLYPLKANMKSSDIERYLIKLSSIKPVPLIILYLFDNIRYLQVTKWDKHQQIRAKRSKYPAYYEEKSTLISNDCNVISDDINRNQMIAYVPVIQSESESNPNPNPIHKTAIEIAIDDFKEFRKKIKAPMTARAVELLKAELEKLAPGDDTAKISILEQSIMNGWKGVFELKADNPKQQGTNGKKITRAAASILEYMGDDND